MIGNFKKENQAIIAIALHYRDEGVKAIYKQLWLAAIAKNAAAADNSKSSEKEENLAALIKEIYSVF